MLDGEIERGHLFLHASLSDQARHASEAEAAIYGLADLLVRRGLVDADELRAVIAQTRDGMAEAGRAASFDIVVREDRAAAAPSPPIDCEARIPHCKAICCRLRFPLTVEEIEHGPVKWDLSQPYFNRHGPHGYCHQINPETLDCGVYDERPAPCRQYSCQGDDRIWKDFDAMVVNQEWIDEHVGRERSPIEMFMGPSSEL